MNPTHIRIMKPAGQVVWCGEFQPGDSTFPVLVFPNGQCTVTQIGNLCTPPYTIEVTQEPDNESS